MRQELKEGETIDKDSHRKHQAKSNKMEEVPVIDDIFLDGSGDVDNTPHKISAGTIDEDFITKTLLDPDLKLSSTISKTPRALITALTSRLKSLEANTNSRVDLSEAFASALHGTARKKQLSILMRKMP